MFKQRSTPTIDVPPYYVRMARHWRMGAQSSDRIRWRLIKRGLSSEQTFKIIELLDQEDYESGGFLTSAFQRHLWIPLRGNDLFINVVPAATAPQARTWLTGYFTVLVLGGMALLINRVLVSPAVRCDLIGYGFMAMGLMGLVMYGLNALFARFS